MIRTLTGTIALALALAGSAYAQDKAPSKAQAAQKQRLKSCNDQAGKRSLKGRERQSFMGDCLSGGASKDKKSR